MKLIVAVVQDYDCDRLLRAITSAGFSATKVSSMGGFLRTRNTTVFVGIDDDRVESCLRIIKQVCQSRVEVQLDPYASEYAEWYAAGLHEVTIGGAVVFLVAVSQFLQFPVPPGPSPQEQ
jgi:uncharacterized protein YaaQ